MANKTIYIRKEDEAKWATIKNKPQWLHTAINTSIIVMAVNQQGAKKLEWKNPNVAYAKPMKDITYKKTGNWGA